MTRRLTAKYKTNHTSYVLYYHVVWGTKKREPLIDQTIAEFLQAFLANKCDELGVCLLAQNILCDHVHLIISLRPTHYIPEVLNYLKGTASHEANNHHKFTNALYWARGYHINTVSKSDLASIIAYVENQYDHHPDKVPYPHTQDRP
jgi:REP element-mobilizing transposase RayT